MCFCKLFKKQPPKKKFSIWKLFAIIGAVVTFAAAGYVLVTKVFKKKPKAIDAEECDADEIIAEEEAPAEDAPAEETAE